MFYSQFILAKKGPLGTIWIAAHLERKLRKNQVADTDIGVSVDSILFPDVPIALRLSSHLLLGVVRIYSRKVNYLFDDCSEALLKVKQAFRSTAVDLPPEESTAPYHSITLPETFDLDDFELPDSDIFQGNYVDHHISTKEQITLQDTMEGVVYSTSQFGLDERFGDGDTSHIGLDLDEDLFLNKVAAPEHAGINLDQCADPQTSGQQIVSMTDENNEELDGPLQTTSAKVSGAKDEERPSSTEFVDYAHAPSTPGLLEEPNLSNVQKALASDDHLESEDHNSTELEVTKNTENSTSKPDHSGDKNVLGQTLLNNMDPGSMLAEENGYHIGELGDQHSKAQGNISAETLIQVTSGRIGDISENSGNVKNLENGILNNNEQNLEYQGGETGLDGTVASPSFSHGIEDSFHKSCFDAEDVPEKSCLDSKTEPVSEGLLENGQASLKPEISNVLATSGHVEESHSVGDALASNAVCPLDELETDKYETLTCDDPNERDILNPPEEMPSTSIHVLKACSSKLDQHDKSSLESGKGCQLTDAVEPILELKQMAPNSCEENEPDPSKLDQEVDKVTSKDHLESATPASSELPAPEKLLSVPEDTTDLPKHLLVDSTPRTEIQAGGEGDGGTETIITGKKRSFTESTFTLESLDESFGRGRSKRTAESIPEDDDLLSSILVGRKSSILKLKPTPPPLEAAPSKRPRTAPRASASKRKVPVDDMMVLHGDTIRQQLTSTEDIRRVRKKAPCTPHEVWMIQKQFLEEEFFNEAISGGMSIELICLHSQPFDLSRISISKVDESVVSLESTQDTEPSERPNVYIEGEQHGNSDPWVLAKDGEEQVADMELERDSTLVVDAVDHVDTPGVDDTRNFPSGPVDELQLDALCPSPNQMLDNSSVDDASKLQSSRQSVDAVDVAAIDDQNLVVGPEPRAIDEPMLEENVDGGSVDMRAGVYADSSAPIDRAEPSVMTLLLETNGSNEPVVSASDLEGGGTDQPLSGVSIEHETGSSKCVRVEYETDMDVNNASLNDGQNGLLNDSGEPFILGYAEVQGTTEVETTGLEQSAVQNITDMENVMGEHDTEFLNVDDDVAEEDDNDMPSADANHILENSGWSSRTRAVARYLQILFDKEAQHGKKIVPLNNLLTGKTRKEASRMFFETLVLKTRDYIHVEQGSPFDNISIKPQSRLMKSDF